MNLPSAQLGFFPAAPSEGPLSMLDLPADDWICQAKIDGCRVILAAGIAFTRQGTRLTNGKGASALASLWREWGSPGILLEGEWVAASSTLHLFDLPDCESPYEQRFQLLRRIAGKPGLKVVPYAESDFRAFYAAWRGRAEGVVMKRRAAAYEKCSRPGTATRNMIKRRYTWDQ